jgi:hypothetical protein
MKKSEGFTEIQKRLDESQKRLDESLAEMQARDKKRKALESLPPDVILQARKMDAENKFHRKVVKRTPRDLLCDTLELECGHSVTGFGGLSEDKRHRCQDCIDRWLLARPRPRLVKKRTPQKTQKKKGK